jgi:membrane protease YdiL (CAAX protease family)
MIMNYIKRAPIKFILKFYIICFVFRAFEYFVLRTDQGVIGEAFVHKLIGIGLLAFAIRLLHYRWRDIGFKADEVLKGAGLGLLLGGIVFFVGYGTEILIQAGNAPALRFYAASYALTGNQALQGGALFIAIVILGNIINVIMEEGVFRGLFITLGEERYSFLKTCLFAALLFGLWHIAQPVRNVFDGVQSPMGAFMNALMLVVTSALLGVQCGLLFKLTGHLWVGMAAHFVNNAIVNLLHVTTATGIDELQALRITIAQTLMFVIVLVMFILKKRNDSIKRLDNLH